MPYVINDTCVGCHNCAMECPTEAIQYKGKKYDINQELCIECGHCEEVCHISAANNQDNASIAHPHDLIKKSCDVVVIGAGCGLISAVRAAQAGKKVIVLEKAKKVGGNTDYAHMFFPVYTKWYEEKNLPDVREDAIEEFSRRTNGVVEKDILRACVYGCGEFFDWLCQYEGVKDAFEIVEMGSVIAEGPIYGPAMISFPKRLLENLKCRDQAIGPGWAGTFIKHLMMEELKKYNAEVLTEHEGRKLLADEIGAISGVLAKNPGGEVQIDCKAVILATGGMQRSDEKMKKFFPEFFQGETPIHKFSVPTDTGDGIDLAEPLGAEIPEDRMFCSIFGPAHHPFSYCIYRLMLQPECVYINLNGKRWLNEQGGLMEGRHIIAQQPKEISYGIMSQEMINEAAKFFINDPKAKEEAWIFKDYQKEIDEEVALGMPVKKADTLEKLAEQIGVDKDTFLEEIKHYNEMCEKGCDEDFHKDEKYLKPIGETGPYYAFYSQRFSEGAFGGLKVSPKTEVMTRSGKAIKGLYATGDATSAVQVRGNLAVVSELTWAVASNYIAGQESADYISDK